MIFMRDLKTFITKSFHLFPKWKFYAPISLVALTKPSSPKLLTLNNRKVTRLTTKKNLANACRCSVDWREKGLRRDAFHGVEHPSIPRGGGTSENVDKVSKRATKGVPGTFQQPVFCSPSAPRLSCWRHTLSSCTPAAWLRGGFRGQEFRIKADLHAAATLRNHPSASTFDVARATTDRFPDSPRDRTNAYVCFSLFASIVRDRWTIHCV